jgi:hypothetical protein
MNNIKFTLIKSKELLEYYIENDDYIDSNDDDIKTIMHYIDALDCGCQCDSYNGFDCGCGDRSFNIREAYKEMVKELKINNH